MKQLSFLKQSLNNNKTFPSIKSITIKKDTLARLWVENEKGDKIIFNPEKGFDDIPKDYIYWHSVFPNQVIHEMHRFVLLSEVDQCDHPTESVVPTCGWTDGIEGRECKKCFGTQVKKKHERWPEKWEANGSRLMAAGSFPFSEDLALAIANSKLYSLGDAILIASQCCERCMNVLANHFGLTWGYSEDSDDARQARTSCQFCTNDKRKIVSKLKKFICRKFGRCTTITQLEENK